MKHMSHIFGWVFSGLGLLPLVLAAIPKLLMDAKMVEEFPKMGYPVFMIPVFGVVALLSVGTYVWGRTRGFGLLLATAYYGGAIALAWSYTGNGLFPAIALMFLWIGALLLNKNAFLS